MKKLNKKGFTLIELLAVIVVLAIVMVIATTTVLNSTRNAAVDSINNSALSVADFVKSQEALYQFGGDNEEECYDSWRGTTISGQTKAIGTANAKCFGLNTTDYDLDNSYIEIKNNGKDVKVSLCASTNGKFKNIASVTDKITVVTPLSGTATNKCVEAVK